MKKLILMLALVSAASTSFAQSPEPFYGEWTVSWKNATGRQFEAQLQLAQQGAFWQSLGTNIQNTPSCFGRKAPVELQPVSDTVAKVLLKYSEALAGCQDYTLNMSMTSATEATGKRGATTYEMKRK